MDGQLLGTKTDPMCATLGRGAPRANCAPGALGTPGAQECQARLVRRTRHVLNVRQVCCMLQPRQVRHVRGTRRVCQVRLRTWRHTSEPCRPPPSLSKTNAQSRRGGHHGVWWACTHQAICQHPRRPFQKPLDRDHRVAARDPDLAAKCILYCFSVGMVAVHTAGNMLAPPPSLSKNNTKCSRGSRA